MPSSNTPQAQESQELEISLNSPAYWLWKSRTIVTYDESVAYISADAAPWAEYDAPQSCLEKREIPTECIEEAEKRPDVLDITAQVNFLMKCVEGS